MTGGANWQLCICHDLIEKHADWRVKKGNLAELMVKSPGIFENWHQIHDK